MTTNARKPRERGPVKFILLHHDGCPRREFHYAVLHDGAVTSVRAETEFAQHPSAIAVVIQGSFDDEPPPNQQIDGLKRLLVQLVRRYPAATIGAHRQVRGDIETTCPGRKFPMRDLARWSETGLPKARDEAIERSVEEQYSKI